MIASQSTGVGAPMASAPKGTSASARSTVPRVSSPDNDDGRRVARLRLARPSDGRASLPTPSEGPRRVEPGGGARQGVVPWSGPASGPSLIAVPTQPKLEPLDKARPGPSGVPAKGWGASGRPSRLTLGPGFLALPESWACPSFLSPGSARDHDGKAGGEAGPGRPIPCTGTAPREPPIRTPRCQPPRVAGRSGPDTLPAAKVLSPVIIASGWSLWTRPWRVV